MKLIITGLFASLLLGLSACSSPNPQAKSYYTDVQYSRLTYCFGMTDTVMYVAKEKLKQLPKVQLIDYYETRPNARLNIAIVNKVYAAHVRSAWQYTLQTFDNCAQHFAGVQSWRIALAGQCEQQTLIAGEAYAYKKFNYPRKDAYRQFSKLKGKMPKKIIDMVYDSRESRGQLKLGIWDACMARVQHD